MHSGFSWKLTQQPDDFDDVPSLLAAALNNEAPNGSRWGDKRAKAFLNNEALGHMTKAMLDQVDPNGEVIGWFRAIEQMIATAV